MTKNVSPDYPLPIGCLNSKMNNTTKDCRSIFHSDCTNQKESNHKEKINKVRPATTVGQITPQAACNPQGYVKNIIWAIREMRSVVDLSQISRTNAN